MRRNNHRDIMGAGFILAVLLVFAYIWYADYHGWYRDMVVDRMHEDCYFCRRYRYMMKDNAAFQIREQNRETMRERNATDR